MSGVLSPRRRLYEPEAAGFRPLDVLKYASPHTAGQAGENPCLSRHSPFLRATADAALLIDPDFIIWPSFMTGSLPANPVHQDGVEGSYIK
jgi:hypothetical protein